MLIGCAAAMVYMWKLLPKTFYKSFCFDALALGSAGAAIFVFAGCPYSDVNYYSFALPVFTASIAVIVLWLATRETSVFHSVLEIKAMGWTGRISYGLYLWHSVMYEASGKFFASSAPGVRVFIGIFLAFAAASVSYYLVEKIFLSAKDKLTGAVVK
jgi:peptidoglycan/LPS O-acetylase OafA/YrhL